MDTKRVAMFGVWMSVGCSAPVVDDEGGAHERAQYANCIVEDRNGNGDLPCAGAWAFQVPDQCAACLCSEDCDADADCAAPAGASAVGVCVDQECVLQCGADNDCPEGMLCAQTHRTDDAICIWASDDPFVCAESNAGDDVDPCEAIADEATCNATMSATLDDRCLWVEGRILSTTSESCEPAGTQGHCLRVREAGGSCGDIDVCGGGSTRVLWNDLGAGTAEILALDCSLDLRSHAGTSCDFTGGVGIPLACACGCPE